MKMPATFLALILAFKIRSRKRTLQLYIFPAQHIHSILWEYVQLNAISKQFLFLEPFSSYTSFSLDPHIGGKCSQVTSMPNVMLSKVCQTKDCLHVMKHARASRKHGKRLFKL